MGIMGSSLTALQDVFENEINNVCKSSLKNVWFLTNYSIGKRDSQHTLGVMKGLQRVSQFKRKEITMA